MTAGFIPLSRETINPAYDEECHQQGRGLLATAWLHYQLTRYAASKQHFVMLMIQMLVDAVAIITVNQCNHFAFAALGGDSSDLCCACCGAAS